MLIFKMTMDPNSTDLYRCSKYIGRYSNYPHQQPQLHLMPLETITIEEMKQVIDRHEEIQTKNVYDEIEIKRD